MLSSRFGRRIVYLFCIFIGCILFLNGCWRMQTSDKTAIRAFKKMGLSLLPQTIQINGHNLHYVSVGSDTLPTIVFIHGSPGSWDAFEDFLKDTVLTTRYRLISIDRPGFGFSDFGEAQHLQTQSAIIGLLLKLLQNAKPLYLVGHSLGGPLVAQLAADFPPLINGIIVLSGALSPALEPKESWRPIMMNQPFCYLLPGAMRPSNTELWYLKKDLVVLQSKLSLVACPVFIMHGQKDMLVTVDNVSYMKQQFTNAAIVKDTIFPNENHFIPWTQHLAIRQWIMKLAAN